MAAEQGHTAGTASLPCALWKYGGLVTGFRQAADSQAHLFPYVIVAMFDPDQGMGDLMQNRVFDMGFGIAKDVVRREFYRFLRAFADPELSFAVIESE